MERSQASSQAAEVQAGARCLSCRPFPRIAIATAAATVTFSSRHAAEWCQRGLRPARWLRKRCKAAASTLVFKLLTNSSAVAATAVLLDWRALYRAEGAVHAAVARDWTQDGLATLTFVEELTGVRWHGFGFGMPAVWTRERGVKNHSRHRVHFLGVAGKPASVDALAKVALSAFAGSYLMVAVLCS